MSFDLPMSEDLIGRIGTSGVKKFDCGVFHSKSLS